MKAGTAIRNSGKVCSIYNSYNRHGKPWNVKEGGGTGYIRHRTGQLF